MVFGFEIGLDKTNLEFSFEVCKGESAIIEMANCCANYILQPCQKHVYWFKMLKSVYNENIRLSIN